MIFTDAKKSSLAFPFYAIQNQLFVKNTKNYIITRLTLTKDSYILFRRMKNSYFSCWLLEYHLSKAAMQSSFLSLLSASHRSCHLISLVQ